MKPTEPPKTYLTQAQQDEIRAAEVNRKCNHILKDLQMADEMVVKGYPDAQCASLYIACGEALVRVKDQTEDDGVFQQAIVWKIRETVKRAQKCTERIARKDAEQRVEAQLVAEQMVEPPQPMPVYAGGAAQKPK